MPQHKVDEALQPILDRFAEYKVPPIASLTPQMARMAPTLKNAVEDLTAENMGRRATTMLKPMPEPVGSITHMAIPGPGSEILLRIYTPEGDGLFPGLVYFHGGGFVFANLDVYDPSCRALCNAAECVVVSVAYRQAPEHKFPAAPEDAYAAVQWVMENGSQIGIDTKRVAVGGESAGGNLSVVSSMMARDKGGLMPIFQLLIYPVVDGDFTRSSYRENGDQPPLLAEMMPWFFKHYLNAEADGQNPYAAPIHGDLSGLPPALVITAQCDVLRDEGEEFADKLVEAGTPARWFRYDGMTHEFFGTAGVVPVAMQALEKAVEYLNDAFTAVQENRRVNPDLYVPSIRYHASNEMKS